MIGNKNIFWVLPVECWKMSSWEGSITEQDIQHTHKSPLRDGFFSLFIINLGYGIKINRQIAFG